MSVISSVPACWMAGPQAGRVEDVFGPKTERTTRLCPSWVSKARGTGNAVVGLQGSKR